jgi:ERCC4-related helicase
MMSSFSPHLVSAVYERISYLLSLVHAKKLLLTHGVESFSDYMTNFFDIQKKEKEKKNCKFLKDVKETEEYKDLIQYIDETKSTKNHPKLKKLNEILTQFFKDPKH